MAGDEAGVKVSKMHTMVGTVIYKMHKQCMSLQLQGPITPQVTCELDFYFNSV